MKLMCIRPSHDVATPAALLNSLKLPCCWITYPLARGEPHVIKLSLR